MKTSVYLGLDVGASALTGLGVDADGQVVAVCRGSGANSFADPAGAASFELVVSRCLRSILSLVPGAVIVRAVLGVAGLLARPEVGSEVRGLFATEGIDGEPVVVNDAETMFASGSAAEDGHCLSVGTGAIGIAIRRRRAVRTVDGHGWLLGDAGSAVWIGLSAIRAVLAALEGQGQPTSLTGDVPKALENLSRLPCPVEAVSIVSAAHQVSPRALGRIALLVEDHARDGDQTAQRILRDAAQALSRTLTTVVGNEGHLPIVLGGSVVYSNSIIRQHLEEVVADRWPKAPVRIVQSGAPGAALWARRLDGYQPSDDLLDRVHRQMVVELNKSS